MMEVELGDLYLDKGGSLDPAKYPEETFEYYSIPAYDTGEPKIILGSEIGSSKKVFQPNDIILSRIVPHIRRCWVVGSDSGYRQIGSGEWITFRSENIEPSYLRHYLMSNEFNAKFLKTIKGIGGSLMRADPKQVARFNINLPPLDQQKKIAAILDAADAYRQKTKALIEKYDELTQSLFLDMFGDPVTNPKGWEVKTLNNVCSKITDGTHHSPTPQESGYPYVTAKHVKPFRLNFLSKPSYVSKDAHTEIYKRCTPELGDVLYIKDGATTGIACVNTFDEPISMLSSLALLKPGNEVNNQYLCYWLNHKGIKQKLISEFMSGAAIKRFTLKKINSFKLMIPNIELQNQFAERVQAIEEQKAQAQASLAQAEDLFNSLLQRAFKGELTS